MARDIMIMVLLFFTGLQGGFLLKSFLDYQYGPVPMITPSELVGLLEER